MTSLVLLSPAWGQPPITLTDIALEVGFQDRLAHGRALVGSDFNGDGWVDFFIGNPGEPTLADDDSFILWNEGPDQNGEFSFRKGQVLLKGELAFTASAADFDSDGDPDLFVGIGGQEGIGLDYLFRNDAGWFVDVSDTARIRGPWAPENAPVEYIPTATSSGNWADYDNDGDLDLFVASRVWDFVEGQSSWPLPGGMGYRNSLFRNDGGGTFTDVTFQAGLGQDRSSMTATWGDLDDDGWMDLFVPHYLPSGFQLLHNLQDGTFEDVAPAPSEVQFGQRATWASAMADFNRDGRLDILSFARGTPGSSDSHALLINQGDWTFTNEARSSGLAPLGSPVPAVMGTQVGDLNNDGLPEVFFGNGGPTFGQRDTLFLNTTQGGTVRFLDISQLIDYPAPEDPDCVASPAVGAVEIDTYVDSNNMLPGEPGDDGSVDTSLLAAGASDPCKPTYPYRGHGAVLVDFDKDGDLDLAMVKGGTAILAPSVSSTEPNRFFRNDGGNAKNWLIVELEGTVSNPDAYGSRVTVTSSQGGAGARQTVRHVQGNTNFSSSGPKEVHFGLGDDDRVDRLVVSWPSGVETTLEDLSVNQRLELTEPATFVSTFDGNAEGWSALSGEWTLAEGMYGTSSASDGRAVWTAMGSATDYTVVARVTFGSGAKEISLFGRSTADGWSHYGVGLRDSTAQLYKMIDGRVELLGDPIAIEPMTTGRSYIVRLTFEGSTLSMAVDRQAAPPVTDTELTSGIAGMGTVQTQAAFDNLAVY